MTAAVTTAGRNTWQVTVTMRTVALSALALLVAAQVAVAFSGVRRQFPERLNWQLHEPVDQVALGSEQPA